MTTRYQCQGCKEIFEGFDPAPFGPGKVVYPPCPRGELLTDAVFRKGGSLEAMALATGQIEDDHPVALAVIDSAVQGVKPALPASTSSTPQPLAGQWGTKLVITAMTPEQEAEAKVERELAAKAAKRREAEDAADTAARKLVQRIEADLKQGNYTTSSKFPSDREYGFKGSGAQYSASADIIHRASVMWLLKGTDYSYRPPSYKKDWQQDQANFEKLIVSGDKTQGKHNFHVVLI